MIDQEKFNKAVMIWISEATRLISSLGYDDERYQTILADPCGQCWTAFEAMKNHDAVSAARAAEPESSVPLGSECGTDNTQEPVAWAVMSTGGGCLGVSVAPDEAHYRAKKLVYVGQEPCGSLFVLPLYRSPTLTDEERKAITEASDFYVGTRTGVTLRGLLERLGGAR